MNIESDKDREDRKPTREHSIFGNYALIDYHPGRCRSLQF
jgi:hypothetical protein